MAEWFFFLYMAAGDHLFVCCFPTQAVCETFATTMRASLINDGHAGLQQTRCHRRQLRDWT